MINPKHALSLYNVDSILKSYFFNTHIYFSMTRLLYLWTIYYSLTLCNCHNCILQFWFWSPDQIASGAPRGSEGPGQPRHHKAPGPHTGSVPYLSSERKRLQPNEAHQRGQVGSYPYDFLINGFSDCFPPNNAFFLIYFKEAQSHRRIPMWFDDNPGRCGQHPSLQSQPIDWPVDGKNLLLFD